MLRRVMLSTLMFLSLMGVMQTEVHADNGKVTVSQVTYSANTNMDKYYFVELYYETGQMTMVNGMMHYEIVRSEPHSGFTTVSSLPMGPMTYYIHLKDFNGLVVGRVYKWRVWNTKVDAATGLRVADLDLGAWSSGQTTAVAP